MLADLIGSDVQNNPAYATLVSDYQLYHAVLVCEGGVFAILLALQCWFCWRRFRRGRHAFERRVYAGFGLACAVVFPSLLLLVAANLSNVLDPQAGFAHAIPELGMPQDGTPKAALYQAVAAWLESGTAPMPAPLQEAVQARLAWQAPKAALCSFLLVVGVALSIMLWRGLIRTPTQSSAWNGREQLGVGAGILAVPLTLLLLIMALANTQAALAPIVITLLFS